MFFPCWFFEVTTYLIIDFPPSYLVLKNETSFAEKMPTLRKKPRQTNQISEKLFFPDRSLYLRYLRNLL